MWWDGSALVLIRRGRADDTTCENILVIVREDPISEQVANMFRYPDPITRFLAGRWECFRGFQVVDPLVPLERQERGDIWCFTPSHIVR